MSDYIPKILRTAVAERAKGSCEYCLSQAKFATKANRLDATDAVTRQQVALYNPRQHDWNEHFCLRRALYGLGEHPSE